MLSTEIIVAEVAHIFKKKQMKIIKIDKPKNKQKNKHTEYSVLIESDLIDRGKQCRSSNIKIDIPVNNEI